MNARNTIVALVLLGALACSKEPEAREWTPQDHAHPENRSARNSPMNPATVPSASDGIYVSTCAPCHGANGKGDGPMGRALRVADLSSPSWQRNVTDEDIAKVIKDGRGKMPAFNMPPERIDAMVKKVRTFGK